MLQRCLRFHSSLRIPNKATCNEVNKVLVLTPQNLSKCFRSRSSATTLGVNHRPGCAIVVFENVRETNEGHLMGAYRRRVAFESYD
jgi:hypothetical protein